ncbi:MAG: hypothetical protein GY855_11150 [candidate division Zixibacteria bacterium]|nr:hypothetical protein [candidate division Zixibacteria bacterium]
MRRLRIILSLAFSAILLMAVWGHISEQGYEKVVKPNIEKHKKMMEEQMRMVSEATGQEIAALGESPMEYLRNMKDMYPEGMGDFKSYNPERPKGKYIGVRKNDSNKMAFMEFGRNDYKMLIKNSGGDDYIEKGKFEFWATEITFKPKNKPQYSMEFYQYSKETIQLSGNGYKLNLEKDDNFDFEF